MAQQQVIVFQLEQESQRRGWTRADLADRLRIPYLAIDHLLDPEDLTVNLQLLARAAELLGQRLRITLL